MRSMKRRLRLGLLVLVLLIPLSFMSFLMASGGAGSPDTVTRSIQNIETFARLYGYVRYFYPGDEAAAMDWERLAVYGVKQVKKARDAAELKSILEELFMPIAPALIIHETRHTASFPVDSITPPGAAGMNVVGWQHLGVGFGSSASLYKSIRLNRKNILSAPSNAFGTITRCLDAAPYRGKPIKLRAAAKVAAGQGQLWLRVDKQSGNMGFFDNMGDRPAVSNQWNYYEIKGTVDADAQEICYGCMLVGRGNMWTDDFQLYVKEDSQSEIWKPIAIPNPDFEADKEGIKPEGWGGGGNGYSFQVTSETAAKGGKSVHVQSQDVLLSNELFPQKPPFGTIIAKELGSGLSCLMPIALYGTETQTVPVASLDQLGRLKAAINKDAAGQFSVEDPDARLADIVISWNIFQHFFPYFDAVKTDWKAALPAALADAWDDKNQQDFLKTLRRFTAKLKDGHVRVILKGDTSESFCLPLAWEWIENQLVITGVFDGTLTQIKVGDVVAKINGVSAKAALEKEEQYISAATLGWKRYRSLYALLVGEKNQEFRLEIAGDGKTHLETLRASLGMQEYYDLSRKAAVKSKTLEEGIYYLNLDQIGMEEIDKLMPELEKAKAIICDLRGYPKSNHQLICHLLKEKDTAQWMWVPQIIYPDYQQVTYLKTGWFLEPLKPRLTAKMFFITDGRAISYAESFLGYIEGYKLATIVGQPSAGTNGDINPFPLPGGYFINWTGLRVLKLDGSQHHGVGIIPNVAVERTIKGVKEGRDEFLEKALELARK